MSTNPELTPAALEELRTALLRRHADLLRQIADLQQNVSGRADPLDDIAIDAPGDRGDASVDLQDFDDTHQLVLDLQAQLAEVEHALAKFDAGTYGICERCGRPIPLARLRVLPEARYIHLVRDGRDVAESVERQWHARPDWQQVLRKARTFPLLQAPGYAATYARTALRRAAGRADHRSVWGPRYAGMQADLQSEDLITVCSRHWPCQVPERQPYGVKGTSLPRL